MTKLEWNPLKCKFATNIPFRSHYMNYVPGNITCHWYTIVIGRNQKEIFLLRFLKHLNKMAIVKET